MRSADYAARQRRFGGRVKRTCSSAPLTGVVLIAVALARRGPGRRHLRGARRRGRDGDVLRMDAHRPRLGTCLVCRRLPLCAAPGAGAAVDPRARRARPRAADVGVHRHLVDRHRRLFRRPVASAGASSRRRSAPDKTVEGLYGGHRGRDLLGGAWALAMALGRALLALAPVLRGRGPGRRLVRKRDEAPGRGQGFGRLAARAMAECSTGSTGWFRWLC